MDNLVKYFVNNSMTPQGIYITLNKNKIKLKTFGL